jgi:hypothetical protein
MIDRSLEKNRSLEKRLTQSAITPPESGTFAGCLYIWFERLFRTVIILLLWVTVIFIFVMLYLSMTPI